MESLVKLSCKNSELNIDNNLSFRDITKFDYFDILFLKKMIKQLWLEWIIYITDLREDINDLNLPFLVLPIKYLNNSWVNEILKHIEIKLKNI